MSAASSSTNSIESQLRQPGFTLQVPEKKVFKRNTREDDFHTPTPRPIARHYTSLEEHADVVRQGSVTPGGGGSTPRPDDRREGFTWEVHDSEESRPNPYVRRIPAPDTPPPLEELIRSASREDAHRERGPSVTSSDTLPSQTSTMQLSAASSFSEPMSRSDTARSSFSGLARGVMKHVPDMRMFMPVEKKPDDGEQSGNARSGRRKSKAGRRPMFDVPSTSQDIELQERSPKSPTAPAVKPSDAAKGSLRDRRKFANGEAMKITLPVDLPELPSRSRAPATDLNSIVPSRPRSPKTPWILDHPPPWYASGPATAPPTILEDGEQQGNEVLPGNDTLYASQTPQAEESSGKAQNRRSGGRVRFGRSKSGTGTSDSSLPQSPGVSYGHLYPEQMTRAQQGKTEEELKELGKRSRTRRWPWSTAWAPIDIAESPTSNKSMLFPLPRFLKSKRSGQKITSPNKCNTDRPSWHRRQSIPVRPDANVELIANMPVPPAFVPPGVQRVPTPPMFDERGEVKGKLADFFFDLQGVRTHKPPPTPGSIWDSDVLLMSQASGISPPASERSDESPQQTTPTPDATENPIPTVITPTGVHLGLPGTPTSPPPHLFTPNIRSSADSSPEHWYRNQSSASKDSATRRAEEQAKLEWLIPEHYPNSPLCPLHAKYRGPSQGYCVFHGRSKVARPGVQREERRISEIMDGTKEMGTSRRRQMCRMSSP